MLFFEEATEGRRTEIRILSVLFICGSVCACVCVRRVFISQTRSHQIRRNNNRKKARSSISGVCVCVCVQLEAPVKVICFTLDLLT